MIRTFKGLIIAMFVNNSYSSGFHKTFLTKNHGLDLLDV